MNARAWTKHEADKTAGALWFASDKCRVRIKLLRGERQKLKDVVSKHRAIIDELSQDAADFPEVRKIVSICEDLLNACQSFTSETGETGNRALDFARDSIKWTTAKKHLIETAMNSFVNYWVALLRFVKEVIQLAANLRQVEIARIFTLPESIRTRPPPLEYRPTIQPNAPAL